jgi:hypothetical protein
MQNFRRVELREPKPGSYSEVHPISADQQRPRLGLLQFRLP